MRLFQTWRRWAQDPRVRGGGRVLGYVAALQLALSLFLAHSARAKLEDSLSRLSANLGPELTGLTSEPTGVVVNGQPMFLTSKTTALGVSAVVDRLEAYCRAGGAAPADDLLHLPELGGHAPPELLRWQGQGIVRSSRDPSAEDQQIACLVRPAGSEGFVGVLDRVQEFALSGNLGALGNVRYFRVRKNEAGLTHVLGIWTQGDFDLFALFSEQGDAKGRDSQVAPRPPASVRTLSAEVMGSSHALRMYESDQTPEAVLNFYDRAMKERGFHTDATNYDPNTDGLLERAPTARVFVRGEDAVLVVANTGEGGQSSVSLVEMGSADVVTGWAKARVLP